MNAPAAPPTVPLDVDRLRADFPYLARSGADGRPVAYLDSGASAQKPRQVLNAMSAMAGAHYANVHRGAYGLSMEATATYENARARVAAFLGAARPEEIVFTANVTAAINLLAHSFGDRFLAPGDAVLISELEHHSNIVPWQMLRARKGIELRVLPIDDDGTFDLAALDRLLDARVKLVAVSHVSNVLGTVAPVAEIAARARELGARLMLDGSQAVMHRQVDVAALGCDFYVFTGHKIYGPTGIGVLYGRAPLLAEMPPFLGGGDMIATVSFDRTLYADPPARFEAGTPPIVEAVGLAAALDYVEQAGFGAIAAHETALRDAATERLGAIPGLRLVGTAADKGPVVSFVLAQAHPHDVATVLDSQGVCVRAGHHCAEPLMARLGLPAGTVRASFGLYNTLAEVERLGRAVEAAQELFA